MFPGDREYSVSISYFEKGKIRGFETPVWAPHPAAALSAGEKFLRTRHPDATVHRCVVVDAELSKMAKPRLVS